MGKKLRQSTETVFVDRETGEEIVNTTSKVFTESVKSTDHFFMTYIDFIAPWFNLKPEIAKTILIWLCKNAEFNTGKVSLTTQKRKDLANEIGITPQTLSNSLTALKKSKLIDGSNGEFQINPQIFWKGSQESRDALLKNATIVMTFGLEDGKEDKREKDIESLEQEEEF